MRRQGNAAASPARPVTSRLVLMAKLSIDPDLLNRALEVSDERTKEAAVTKALQEFIARRRQKRLMELMGRLEWDSRFAYKTDRSRR